MRQGITPVIAVALLLGMSITAAGGAYVWFSQIQEEAQAQADDRMAAGLDLKEVTCYSHEIVVAATNTGDASIRSRTADVSLYRDGDLVSARTLNISGAGFTATGGFGRVSAYLTDNVSAGREYRVEMTVREPSLTATGRCEAVAPPTCREILDAGFSTGNGTYTIDPNGVRGGADGFPVFCDMTTRDGGWMRLNFLPDSHTGGKGAPFGDSDRSPSFGATTDVDQGNLGLVNSGHDPDTSDQSFFQRDSNMRCTRWAAGNATTDTFLGVTTGWDYYDTNGDPIPPHQLRALNRSTVNGTYYRGNVSVNDIDGPFPDGGDGNGGTNGFSIPINTSATHSPTGGGPIVIWLSTMADMDAGTTHALGSDYDSGSAVNYRVSWRPVNTMGVPMVLGGKVDNDANLYSVYDNSGSGGCEKQWGSEFELENQHFYVR